MFANHLDKKITTTDVVMEPSRNGYGEGLLAAGESNSQVVALCADLTESTRTHLFKTAFPERFVEVGIAEQNMASVASGMAAMGKVPFIASYAMFSPGRSWEQVRTTIAYNNANVKIIGAHAGISVGPDGATHQAIEDIALMRVIPNMVVIAPADTNEAYKAVLAAVDYEGPIYIRLGRAATPVVTSEASPFAIGKAEVFLSKYAKSDKSVAIVVTGTLAHTALCAGKELNEQGIATTVLHMPTIKPLDTKALDNLLNEHDAVVTLEEHQIVGGLGGAVAEYVSETNPKKVIRVGMNDEFGQSGSPEELLTHYGLDTVAVIAAAKKALE